MNDCGPSSSGREGRGRRIDPSCGACSDSGRSDGCHSGPPSRLVTNWRDRPDAWPTLTVAAGSAGSVPTSWRRTIGSPRSCGPPLRHFPDDFVFKGGTSLSKGYRCIQRFSEDIDVLILKGDRGAGATSTLMKRIAEAATSELGLVSDRDRRHHGTGQHLAEVLQYPRQVDSALRLPAEALLETGCGSRPPASSGTSHRAIDRGTTTGSGLRRRRI